MRWLAFGTYDVHRHPRVGVLIQGLRAAGDEVVEVNVPLALDTAGRVAMLRQPWRLPKLAWMLARCWALLALRSRRARGAGPDAPDAVLVGYLGHFDVRLARRLFRRTPIVLDHLISAAGTARDRGLTPTSPPSPTTSPDASPTAPSPAGRPDTAPPNGAAGSGGAAKASPGPAGPPTTAPSNGAGGTGGVGVTSPSPAAAPVAVASTGSRADAAETSAGASGGGVKAGLMRWIDRGALASADVVVVDTEEHLAALPADVAPRGVVALVGAGAEWFAAGAARGARPAGGPLKVVFVGLFTPLHGTEYLGEALARLADDERIEVTMVGKGQDYDACRAAAAGNPRVTWVDWVTADMLPALVAAHDVSLGIFGTTAKAQNVVPTKVYQGAAAACAIVTSDTAPQRRALGDDALFVTPGDVAALTATLRALADDRAMLASYQRAAAARAASRFAAATVVEPIRAKLALSSQPPVMQETR